MTRALPPSVLAVDDESVPKLAFTLTGVPSGAAPPPAALTVIVMLAVSAQPRNPQFDATVTAPPVAGTAVGGTGVAVAAVGDGVCAPAPEAFMPRRTSTAK